MYSCKKSRCMYRACQIIFPVLGTTTLMCRATSNCLGIAHGELRACNVGLYNIPAICHQCSNLFSILTLNFLWPRSLPTPCSLTLRVDVASGSQTVKNEMVPIHFFDELQSGIKLRTINIRVNMNDLYGEQIETQPSIWNCGYNLESHLVAWFTFQSYASVTLTHIISSTSPTYAPHCHPWICGQTPPKWLHYLPDGRRSWLVDHNGEHRTPTTSKGHGSG